MHTSTYDDSGKSHLAVPHSARTGITFGVGRPSIICSPARHGQLYVKQFQELLGKHGYSEF